MLAFLLIWKYKDTSGNQRTESGFLQHILSQCWDKVIDYPEQSREQMWHCFTFHATAVVELAG